MWRKWHPAGGINGSWQAYVGPALPAVMEPVWSVQYVPLSRTYRQNSVFLAHLIAALDPRQQACDMCGEASQNGSSAYRAAAASPRKRQAGYVISVDL